MHDDRILQFTFTSEVQLYTRDHEAVAELTFIHLCLLSLKLRGDVANRGRTKDPVAIGMCDVRGRNTEVGRLWRRFSAGSSNDLVDEPVINGYRVHLDEDLLKGINVGREDCGQQVSTKWWELHHDGWGHGHAKRGFEGR